MLPQPVNISDVPFSLPQVDVDQLDAVRQQPFAGLGEHDFDEVIPLRVQGAERGAARALESQNS